MDEIKELKKTSRKQETREKVARKRGWVPPSNLEAPEPPEGFHHRWIRAEYRGMADEKNIIGRLRSGWMSIPIEWIYLLSQKVNIKAL